MPSNWCHNLFFLHIIKPFSLVWSSICANSNFLQADEFLILTFFCKLSQHQHIKAPKKVYPTAHGICRVPLNHTSKKRRGKTRKRERAIRIQ